MSINPYQSPTVDRETPESGMIGSYRFESARTRGLVARVLISVNLLLRLLAVLQLSVQVYMLNRIVAGHQYSNEALNAHDVRTSLLSALILIVFIAGAVAFLLWEHRSFRNLRPLRAEGLSFTPGWSVGYWFVPIVSLWKPLNAMVELWKASDPTYSSDNLYGWREARSSSLLGWWWTAWLVMIVAGRASSAFDREAQTPQSMVTSSYVLIFVNAVAIAAGLLLITIVRRIEQRQQARFEKLLDIAS